VGKRRASVTWKQGLEFYDGEMTHVRVTQPELYKSKDEAGARGIIVVTMNLTVNIKEQS